MVLWFSFWKVLNRWERRGRLKCKLYTLHYILHTMVTLQESIPRFILKQLQHRVANNKWQIIQIHLELVCCLLFKYKFHWYLRTYRQDIELTSKADINTYWEIDVNVPGFFIISLDYFPSVCTSRRPEKQNFLYHLSNFSWTFHPGQRDNWTFSPTYTIHILIIELEKCLLKSLTFSSP